MNIIEVQGSGEQVSQDATARKKPSISTPRLCQGRTDPCCIGGEAFTRKPPLNEVNTFNEGLAGRSHIFPRRERIGGTTGVCDNAAE